MDIQTIINKIQLANYKDEVVKKLEGDIKSINVESVKETVKNLKQKIGTLKTEQDNQALEDLIFRLEKN